MGETGKFLMVTGVVIFVVGFLVWRGWFGRLPGDIAIEKPNIHIYIPIVTCIALSLLLTFILWLFRR